MKDLLLCVCFCFCAEEVSALLRCSGAARSADRPCLLLIVKLVTTRVARERRCPWYPAC